MLELELERPGHKASLSARDPASARDQTSSGDVHRAGMPAVLSTARGPSARLVGWIGLCALGRGGLGTKVRVTAARKISNLEGGLSAFYTVSGGFGTSALALGDVNGDGIPDLAVGAHYDNDGATWAGAAYVLTLLQAPQAPPAVR